MQARALTYTRSLPEQPLKQNFPKVGRNETPSSAPERNASGTVQMGVGVGSSALVIAGIIGTVRNSLKKSSEFYATTILNSVNIDPIRKQIDEACKELKKSSNSRGMLANLEKKSVILSNLVLLKRKFDEEISSYQMIPQRVNNLCETPTQKYIMQQLAEQGVQEARLILNQPITKLAKRLERSAWMLETASSFLEPVHRLLNKPERMDTFVRGMKQAAELFKRSASDLTKAI